MGAFITRNYNAYSHLDAGARTCEGKAKIRRFKRSYARVTKVITCTRYESERVITRLLDATEYRLQTRVPFNFYETHRRSTSRARPGSCIESSLLKKLFHLFTVSCIRWTFKRWFVQRDFNSMVSAKITLPITFIVSSCFYFIFVSKLKVSSLIIL